MPGDHQSVFEPSPSSTTANTANTANTLHDVCRSLKLQVEACVLVYLAMSADAVAQHPEAQATGARICTANDRAGEWKQEKCRISNATNGAITEEGNITEEQATSDGIRGTHRSTRDAALVSIAGILGLDASLLAHQHHCSSQMRTGDITVRMMAVTETLEHCSKSMSMSKKS